MLNNLFRYPKILVLPAAQLMAAKPGVSRYEALAEFAKASFDPMTVSVDETYRTIPKLDKSMIRSIYVAYAQERFDTALALADIKKNRPDDEVAWIRASPLRSETDPSRGSA